MPIGRHERFEWYLKVGGWTGRGIVPHPVNQKRRTRQPYAAPEVRRNVVNDPRVITLRRWIDLVLWRKKKKEEEEERKGEDSRGELPAKTRWFRVCENIFQTIFRSWFKTSTVSVEDPVIYTYKKIYVYLLFFNLRNVDCLGGWDYYIFLKLVIVVWCPLIFNNHKITFLYNIILL